MEKRPLDELFDAMFHGKYKFAEFIELKAADNSEKKLIGDRVVFHPNKRLKAFHSFLNLLIFEKLDVNANVVFSYRKGVNAYDAVIRHADSRHFLHTDFSDFFASINSVAIRTAILEGSEAVPVLDLVEYVDHILELVTLNDALPAGFPTSPVLSNACLSKFDSEVLQHCQHKGLVYTRYADDAIISGNSREELAGFLVEFESIASRHFMGTLRLNASKTRYSHVGGKVKLLGLVILPNHRVSIDMNLKKKIETLLHFYLTDKPRFFSKIELERSGESDGLARMSGYLSYVNAVDRIYLDKLRKKYGATIVDYFLHYSPK